MVLPLCTCLIQTNPVYLLCIQGLFPVDILALYKAYAAIRCLHKCCVGYLQEQLKDTTGPWKW